MVSGWEWLFIILGVALALTLLGKKAPGMIARLSYWLGRAERFYQAGRHAKLSREEIEWVKGGPGEEKEKEGEIGE